MVCFAAGLGLERLGLDDMIFAYLLERRAMVVYGFDHDSGLSTAVQ